MRLLFIFSILSLLSCENKISYEKNSFKLNYNTLSKEDIFLYKFENNQPLKIDSSKDNLNHYFEIDAPLPEIYLIGNSLNKSLLFIAENKLSNTIDKKNNNYPFKIELNGDSTNIILQSYFDKKNQLLTKIGNINDNSVESKDSIKKLLKIHSIYVKKFITDHKNSPAILLLLSEVNNPLEFKKELLIIKEVVENRYKNNMFLTEVNKIIAAGNNQEQFLRQQKLITQQQEEQKKELGIEIGAKAPEINLKDPNGKLIPLSSLKGNIVLLDFWASWCRPCRAENPNLVRLYKKYKSSQFTVYSVSMDNNKQKWIDAIKNDQLLWKNHVSDLNGWNSQAGSRYGVTSIPSTFLIDKKGRICAYNLRGEELERKVIELINS